MREINIFTIKQNELKLFTFLFLMFFSITAAIITGSTVRDSVFLLNFDRDFLPLMYILVAILVSVFMKIYKPLSANTNEIKIITYTGLFFVISLIIFNSKLDGWMIPMFYLWMELIIILSLLQFWILAGIILNTRQAKRMFPLITTGGSLAVISSGYCMKPFIKTYGFDSLLILTIIFLSLSIFLSQFIYPYIKKKNKPHPHKQKKELKGKPILDPYLKSIAVMIICSAVITKIIDYQFKIFAVNTFSNPNDLVNFFGSYYMYTGFATFLMQSIFSPFILTNYGILAGLMILPLAISLGSIGFLALGSLTTIFISKFSDQVFKFSINNAVKEILWLPLSSKKRNKSKPIIDGTIKSIAEGIAGVLIFTLVTFQLLPESKIYLLSLLVLVISVYWLWNLFKIKNGYVSEIIKSIENRQLNLDEVKFDLTEANTIKTLNEALKNQDEFKQLFALDLLWNLPLDPWKETIVSLFKTGSYPIKLGVLELAWKEKNILPDKLLFEQVKNINEITPYAITCSTDREINNIKDTIKPYLNSEDSTLKSSAAIALYRLDPDNNQAKDIINIILLNGKKSDIIETIKHAKYSPAIFDQNQIMSFLISNYVDIQNQALVFIRSNPDLTFFDTIIEFLAIPVLRINAVKALLSYPKIEVQTTLFKKFTNKKTEKSVTIGILRIIHHFYNIEIVKIIISKMDNPDLDILNESSDALVKIFKTHSLNDQELLRIENLIQSLSKRAFQLHIFQDEIINDKDALLIIDHINTDLKILCHVIIKLGTLKNSNVPLETYIRYIESNDPDVFPLVLELIESTFSNDNRRLVISLIDPESDPVKSALDYYGDQILSEDEMLKYWIENPHKWKTNIAIQYILKKKKISLLKKLNKKNKHFLEIDYFSLDEKHSLSKNFIKLEMKNEESPIMYSVLEKTILLKSVNLFKNIPGSTLSKIAQLASEVQFDANYGIFDEGDHGDSLYVIISGKVSITNNNQSIAILETGECIGEMSLLDQQPRSAGAFATEDSILLKIDQESFYELMASNPEIMKEIVKILTKRVRDINKKFTENHQEGI